ncbi:MAG: pseudouridine-5'-phosphate glycosidase [Anaerolineaceae bacterium]
MENAKHPQNKPILPPFVLLPEIAEAKQAGKPIVALESTVITHGLPWPQNANLAAEMEQKIRAHGAIPATVALIAGQVHVGLTAEEVALLAQSKQVRKVSTRDLGAALAKHELGGTTVAATMFAAEQQGIRVFATGGIGGVHREAPFDVSNDLVQLGRSPVIVVCAGAKSILDIPATIEYLETQGVPVVGWKTKQFPAFFSEDSGLPVEITAESAEEVAQIARAHWLVGLRGGILVVVPPPAEHAVPYKKMEKIIQKALRNARSEGIKGNKVTPYLLAKVSELSGGESLEANLALLLNNAGVAAQIACALGSYN